MSLVTIGGVAILLYLVGLQVVVFGLGVLSWSSLRREQHAAEDVRLFDMVSSVTTPPVSVIVPAYNEERGIADVVRSLAMLRYPLLEIVVVNDGSTDGTLSCLQEAFDLYEVDMPIRPQVPAKPVRATYRTRLPLPILVVDKENGGKGDAINAGINVTRYPYFLATDADIVLDDECLLRMMRPVAEDRKRVIAVGGNVRPLNGSMIRRGKVTKVDLPRTRVEISQILEYLRSFVAARPGWSRMNALVLISGALGLFQKAAVVEVGGFRRGHLGEDMELTMRLHRHGRDRRRDHRIVYAPDAVAWTEVPASTAVLRRQRIRWHRGLMQVTAEYWRMMFRPRYGILGTFAWPVFVLFELLAPVLELIGYLTAPVIVMSGIVDPTRALALVVVALAIGILNTALAVYLDDRFGHYGQARHAARLLWMAVVEHFGIRQRTVWWRVRAMFWRGEARWGDMGRSGVGNLGRRAA